MNLKCCIRFDIKIPRWPFPVCFLLFKFLRCLFRPMSIHLYTSQTRLPRCAAQSGSLLVHPKDFSDIDKSPFNYWSPSKSEQFITLNFKLLQWYLSGIWEKNTRKQWPMNCWFRDWVCHLIPAAFIFSSGLVPVSPMGEIYGTGGMLVQLGDDLGIS